MKDTYMESLATRWPTVILKAASPVDMAKVIMVKYANFHQPGQEVYTYTQQHQCRFESNFGMTSSTELVNGNEFHTSHESYDFVVYVP